MLVRPCEGDLGRQPYAKRECALLYSDVFAPCHNVVSLTAHMHNTHQPLQPLTWQQLHVFRHRDEKCASEWPSICQRGGLAFFFKYIHPLNGCTGRGIILWKDQTGQKVRQEWSAASRNFFHHYAFPPLPSRWSYACACVGSIFRMDQCDTNT